MSRDFVIKCPKAGCRKVSECPAHKGKITGGTSHGLRRKSIGDVRLIADRGRIKVKGKRLKEKEKKKIKNAWKLG